MLHGYIVPHAPVLLLDHGYPDVVESARRIRRAVRGLLRGDTELVVLVSSHGTVGGVYEHGRGSLADFGLSGFTFHRPVESKATRRLAEAWGRPLLDSPADHGIVVPALLLGAIAAPMVCVTIEEVTGPVGLAVEPAIEAAAALASALRATLEDVRAAIVISAHTSAALSPRAPLLDRPAGHQLHHEVMEALRSDIGGLLHIDPVLWSWGGSCGAGPATVAGYLWQGHRAQVRAEESPAGVGYIVAAVHGDDR